jgi:alpha-beta hydrolase superfamily lysophospholipase
VTLRRILFGLALALVAALGAWVSTPSARPVGADGSRAKPAILKAGIASDALGAGVSTSSARPAAESKTPKPLKLRETCVKRSDRATVVRFRSADGVRLLGVMLGRGPAAVVLAHESDSTLCSWLPYGRTLARRGYRVLVFDARGRGSSSASRSPSRRFRVDLDVSAAAREMRRRGARSVVLAGGSFGAMASIAAGGSVRPPVDGVVPVSPGVTFRGLDAEAAARRLNVPTLFVVAQEDAGFPDAARTLYEATATPDKRLLVVAGFGHGSDVLALSDEARAAVDRFIDDHSRRTLRMRMVAAGADAALRVRR